MGLIRELGRKAWRKYDLDGVSASGFNQPTTDDIFPFIDEIDEELSDLQAEVSTLEVSGDTITRKLWSQLNALTGSRLGQRGEVAEDAGTHTDPVTGTTVANQGIFAWSVLPAGWQWMRANDVATTTAEMVSARSGAPDLKTRINATTRIPTDTEAIKAYLALRDALMGYVDLTVRDGNDKIAFGVTIDGITEMLTAGIYGEDSRVTGSTDVLPIRDRLGNLIAAWNNEGMLRLLGLSLQAADTRSQGSESALDITDDAGHVVFRIGATGQIDFIPSPDLIERIGGGGSSVYPELFDVRRRPNDGRIALCEDQTTSAIYEVIKSPDAPMYLTRGNGIAPLSYIPISGQSNSGQGGNTGVQLSEEVFPFSSAMTYPVRQVYSLDVLAPGSIQGFAPANDAGQGGQWPQTMMQFAIDSFRRGDDPNGAPPGTVSFTTWYGGQPLSAFVTGTNQFTNLVTASARIKVIASGQYKRQLHCPAYVFVQGESGPAGTSTYKAEFLAYANDVLPALQTALGAAQPPKMLISQTSTWVDVGFNGVEIAQLQASKERADIVLAGPMYQLPMGDDFVNPGDIQIHPSALGRMMHGEVLALAWMSVAETGDFIPLQPTTISRSGSNIDINFALPEGNALAFDADWVLAPTGANNPKGFTVLVGGSPVAISSVTLLDADTVRITCASPPGACTVRYAMTADTPEPGYWANSRGLLYSPSDRSSPFAALGYPIPTIIRHYAVKFELEV